MNIRACLLSSSTHCPKGFYFDGESIGTTTLGLPFSLIEDSQMEKTHLVAQTFQNWNQLLGTFKAWNILLKDSFSPTLVSNYHGEPVNVCIEAVASKGRSPRTTTREYLILACGVNNPK